MKAAPQYDVHEIPLADIDATDRLRPVTQEAAQAMALDIEERGLRTPVEITLQPKGKKRKYRLNVGGHRYRAYELLGREAIPAYIVTGSELELRRDEIMENVGRNELSALELATFLAELKRVEQALLGAGRGGDRRSEQAQADQTPNLGVWYEAMAKIRRKSPKTIEAYVGIGERLDEDVAARLVGTPFEDRRQELEALGKYGSVIQNQIADQLLAETNAAPTVKSAAKRIEGQPGEEDDPDERAFRRLLDIWNRSSVKARRRFLDAIDEKEAAA